MAIPTLAVDKAGRLVLPKALRDRFRLHPGSRLEIEVRDDHLRLRPVQQGPAVIDEDGWLVHTGAPDPEADLTGAVERLRGERLGDFIR
jgi:AbrB family looped-hinge helix DNA binding protein